MSKPKLTSMALVGLLAVGTVGCQNLPGDKGTQGAVIGGVGGAAAGAAIGGREHRALGALLGGALGATGGYVLGANSDRILGRDQEAAREAARRAEQRPVTVEEALRATTADINNDGFVTLDEVLAMRAAGLTDAQMLDRMRATDQVFELTAEQRQLLLDRGVSTYVVNEMENINREIRDQLLTTTPAGTTTAPLPAGTPPVIGQPQVR